MSIARFKRYFGYTFWTGLEAALILGLPRLVIFPVAAYLLGKEEFGLFIFSLGIVMMLGKAPSIGLAMGIIRHMAELKEGDRDILVSTAVRLCRIVMLAIVSVGILALGIVRYFWQTDPKIIWCLVPLLIHLYLWNLIDLRMVRYRVERRFALRTAWYSLLGILLFIVIPGAVLGGAVGMAWGYTVGFVVTHIILSWRQKTLFREYAYDVRLGALLKQVWFHVTVAAILGTSTGYTYRIILGIFHSYSSVAIFFGATSIIYLCLAPVNVLGQLLLSMLGGLTHLDDVGKRQKYMVLAGAVSIVVGASLMVLLAGPFVLSVMFPEFAKESAQILRWLVMVIPCSVTMSFCRPFIMKFGPIKLIPVLNFVTFAVHLVPAMILIPKFELRGTVISYHIGYVLSAISWLGGLVWTFKFSKGSKPEVKSCRSINGNSQAMESWNSSMKGF